MHIYTDGSCHGNPGPGGWGFCCLDEENRGVRCELNGFENNTTNNRMELMAIIKSLQRFKDHRESMIYIYTDSMYAMKGITQWIHKWKKNNWITSTKEPVKNRDLWMELDALMGDHIKMQWCKGHDNNPGNERADYLANLAIKNNFQDKKNKYK